MRGAVASREGVGKDSGGGRGGGGGERFGLVGAGGGRVEGAGAFEATVAALAAQPERAAGRGQVGFALHAEGAANGFHGTTPAARPGSDPGVGRSAGREGGIVHFFPEGRTKKIRLNRHPNCGRAVSRPANLTPLPAVDTI